MIRAFSILLALLFWAAPASGDTALYAALGEKEGITRILTHALDQSFEDPRTATQFQHTKKDRLIRALTDQICEVAGGPCKYRGLNMKKAHIKLGITEREFNALVEHLQKAMEQEQVPYRMQNKLLALLAPMKRDIVER